MNAAVYLKQQGWRGEGFSLDATDRGLAKRLLVQRQDGITGLGAKRHDFSNQWWLSSFDKSLKAIGSGEAAVETVADVSQPTQPVVYPGFVKGETLSSTIRAVHGSHSSLGGDSSSPKHPMAKTMATVGSGFVLGESPAQQHVVTAFGMPLAALKENKIKRTKHARDDATEDTSVEGATAEVQKKKKRKVKHAEDIGESVGGVPDTLQATVAFEPAYGEPDQATQKEGKKEKKHKRKAEASDDAEGTVSGKPEQADISEKKKRKKERNERKEQEERDEGRGEEKKEKKAKKEKKGKQVVAEDCANGNPEEDAVTSRGLLATAELATTDTPPVAANTTQPTAPTLVQPVEHAVPPTTGLTNGTAEAALEFIALGDETQETPKKTTPAKAKPKKKSASLQTTYTRPDGTIDPFAIDPATAPGGKKLLHIPTVHPKTGKALSKKARKIIAKKLVKKENKVSREAIRERRAHKKVERVKRNQMKQQKKEAAPKKPSKGEKYAREKAKRVAKREAKERMASGKGTGANSTPIASQ